MGEQTVQESAKKSRTRWISIALLGVLAAALAGCGGQAKEPNQSGGAAAPSGDGGKPAASAPWKVEHEMGVVELKETPQKIIVLDTYLLDIALALGIKPVGIAAESAGKLELPPYLQQQVNYPFKWVGARTDPSLEALADLEPDLIVADLSRHKNGYEGMSKIAPTLVVTGSGAEDWKTIIGKLGEATRQQEKAAAVIADFERKLSEGKAKLAGKGSVAIAPVTLYPKSQVRIYTADSYTGAILHGLGLNLPFTAGGKPFEEISVEKLTDVQADAFVLLQSPQYTQDVVPADYPVFKDLPSVKAGRAHTVGMEQWAFYRGPLAGEIIIREAVEIFSK